MEPGRPPAWKLDPTDKLVAVDAGAIGDRGRVVVPAHVAGGLDWLSRGGIALGTLASEGRLRLTSWATEGELVVARRRELRELAESGDEGATDALVYLENRFVRLAIERGRRLNLPAFVVAHLIDGASPQVFWVRRGVAVELWTAAYRKSVTEEAPTGAEDLP